MFDDLNNSQHYKDCLSEVYKLDNREFDVNADKYVSKDEKFCCPALDDFLDRYGYDLDDIFKIDIYLSTAYWCEWYRNMIENCPPGTKINDPIQDGMCGWIINENRLDLMQKTTIYRRMKAAGIPGFPKTFNTFNKHYSNYSDKYKEWEKYYEEVRHGKD